MPQKVFLWDVYYLKEKHGIGNSRKMQEDTKEKLKELFAGLG